MHYFFLEKQDNLTLRWKVRQVAFDAKYRYLYYSKPLSRTDIEEVMTRSQEAEGGAAVALIGHSGAASPTSSGGTSTRKVKWSGKVKVTQLRYAADEYMVPPSSPDFNEGNLLTLIVVGYERSLEHRPRRANRGGSGSLMNRSLASSSENSFSHRSNASWFRSTSRVSSIRPDSEPDGDEDEAGAASAEQPLLTTGAAEADVPEPESPSGFIHMPSYPVNESLDEDFEDEEENMFRDIDLVPDDEESEEETSVAASEAETMASEDAEDEDDDDDVALNSPASSPTESARSGYSFFSLRRRGAGGGPGSTAKDEKTVQLQFRAANYDVFRIVSLRVRQALVRHGLCGPLHAGLPPYDPRNGIALATVPLHLRHAFRRLNDVVFYSLQIGHVVYVRQQREVRGMEGYLCITHDSILLLQLDGKCPRWLDLEDIVGVQYVLRDNHSFISIRAAEPYPDFVFIPIIPSYPPNSTFDSEECVEGIVSMVRRLLMQRLRAGEEVALAPVSSRRASVHTAEDTDEYDILCHIRDLSEQYTDVFKYIAQEQNTGATPLRWRWDNSKTPTHFTFKRDLYQALEREEGEDTEEDDETSPSRSQRRPFLAPSSHAQMGEAVVPSRQQQHLRSGGGSGSLSSLMKAATTTSSATSRRTDRYGGVGSGLTASPASHGGGVTSHRKDALSRESSLYSNASFLPATMTQLMAPPSRGAELRAKARLQVTRTDRRNASPARGGDSMTGAGTAAANSSTTGDGGSVAIGQEGAPSLSGNVKTGMRGSGSGGDGGATAQQHPTQQLPSASKPTFTTSSMGTIPYTKSGSTTTAGTAYDGVPRIHVTTVPTSAASRSTTDTPPPSQAAASRRGTTPHAPLTSGSVVSGQRSPDPSRDADNTNTSAGAAGVPSTATTTASATQRPPSTRPNTYGLVPSQQHSDPTGLDYWLSATTPNVAPVATAPKGVQLSDIHSSMQQQQQQFSSSMSNRDPASPCASSNASGRPAVNTPASTTPGTTFLGTTAPIPAATNASTQQNGSNSTVNGGGNNNSNNSGGLNLASTSMWANASSSGLLPSASVNSGHGGAGSNSTRGGGGGGGNGHSSSAGPRGSATNGSRSPQEVTHTTENVSAADEDEESDEDFDSEDMEDMLQRPESRGLPPQTHEQAAATTSMDMSNNANSTACSATAAGLTANGVVGGTPGVGMVPVESPGFVQVAEGIVTPAVLTADLLPGFRPRDSDRRSETASAPSPSLQARPDMVAFIPPAVLPK